MSRTALTVAVAVALTDTVGRWAASVALGTGVQPIGFVLVAAALVTGRPARWGSAAGLFAAGVVLGDWTGAVVHANAAFVATTIAVRLWDRSDGRDVGWMAWLPSYVVVAVTALFAFAATSAVLSDVLGRVAFGSTLGRIIVTTLPLALVGAPVVRPLVERAAGTPWSLPGRSLSGRSRTVVVGTVLCWAVGGYVGSLLFGAVEQAPEGAFARRFSPAVEAFIALWGPGGTYAQLLLGVAALAVVAVVLRRSRSGVS